MVRIFIVILALGIFNAQAVLAKQLWQLQEAGKNGADTPGQITGINGVTKANITLDSATIFAMQPGDSADIFLPDGTAVSALLENIKGHSLGGRSWLGWAGKDERRGRIVMTSVNGFTFGAITYDNRIFLIEPVKNSSGYVLYSSSQPGMTEFGFGNDEVMAAPDQPSKAIENNTPGLARPLAVGTTGTVDVGIFYHSSMRDRWGLALSARLQFLVQNYDTAMLDSATGIRGNLVHISEVSGTLAKSNGDTLMDFSSGATNADGDFSGVAAIRDAKGFDIAVYVRRFKSATHSSCGNGFVGGSGSGGGAGSISAASSNGGFSVTSDDFDIDAATGSDGRPAPGVQTSFCNIFTMAHEIGHNMGNTHEAGSSGSGVFAYSHGHRVDGEFRTIMSRSSGTGEPRLGFYSSPTLMKCADSNGVLMACGVADVSDNVRSMTEEGKNVQLYKTAAPRVVSSVLPVSRSIKSDATATAFAVVINPAGTGVATDCMLSLPGASASQFSFQRTTSANVLTGTPNTPKDIPDGGVQNYIFSITPGGEYAGSTPDVFSPVFVGADLAIDFSCSNRQSAESIAKLNTLSFVAEAGDVMDVIALAASAIPGIVETGGSIGAFAVSVSNIGVAGTITASGITSSPSVTATVTVCETVPSTGACKAPPSATVVRALAKDETATFGFFVAETATIIADFATKRIIAQFKEGTILRGATSVAVRSGP